MSNLIDRQAAIDVMLAALDDDWESDYAKDRMCELPSAQPEIIRCKDCKHRPIVTRAGEKYGFSLDYPDDLCPMECDDPWYNRYPEDDFYCAHAERKEK